MIWVIAVVFTILTFYRKDVLLFPLLSSAHWFFLAVFVQDIDFIGFGSQNKISWTADLMDFGGLVALPYFWSGLGIVMMIVALYHLMIVSKKGVDKAWTGGAFDDDNM